MVIDYRNLNDKTKTYNYPIPNNCNYLFSRFEQQILFLEKLAEMMEPTTDRHGHDGPSRALRTVEGVSFQKS